ncbi:PSD1 and planctomycete cytochrome C domain-containing protein [Neorhodopirellula lusitana]|uniref:PSD1 and planctomycete cytochrome C domain-containing protein n=1 Tax=Neorhodopirellula lusitana TaxID=445327 RepID=UPI0024B77302|nr:PSD1 and planctomycete cytochrome C domain-containing protein [Neorhodopirellula lusitana]
MSDKCFQCHGPGEPREADLRLDNWEDATEYAIVPGDSNESLFAERILTDDQDMVMPPPNSHKKLSNEEKEILIEWINQGARFQGHWSYAPIPKFDEDVTIDSVVQSSLADEGLRLQERASKRTLLRRLSLDLTGLPPTLEELQEFTEDTSQQAYLTAVDRLLSSPRFGEHMAKYWLDLVRYADSHGLHADNYREMFLYRDWVIQAFNKNMPYDQFAIQQIAGDLLPEPSTDQLIASGFNRLHISNSAGSALEEELYVNNVKDRVNAFGTVFLGVTLECAACHDHKFDPITQKEYYSLFSFFNNLDGPPDNKGVKSPPPMIAVPTAMQKALAKSLQEKLADASTKNEREILTSELRILEDQYPTTLIMKERSDRKTAFLLLRGEYDNRGRIVDRSTPEFLPPMKTGLPTDRLGLAIWLTSPEHPLTARVAVNRFWQQLFGTGISRTSADFGTQGEWPSNLELLNLLARRFIDSGWNIKNLMRRIVTSQTYQQHSDAGAEAFRSDPDNRKLARGPRFRLDSEVLRDQALFVSGQLDEAMFGPSVKPPQPEGLWKSVSLPGVSRPESYMADKGSSTVRRSVYTYWKRAYPPPTMTIFDAPSRETCVARRARTNTPLQALVLMNEEQFFLSAQQLASSVLERDSSDEDRMHDAFTRLTARQCNETELNLLMNALRDFREQYSDAADSELKAWTMIMNSIFSLDIVRNKP